MMQKGNNYEKSPFSIKKYDGAVNNKNTIAYHPTKEFKKELESFFVDVFGDDISKNDAMDIIVKDYFYRYSYKSKGYYGKTLVALIPKQDLKEMHERNNEYDLKIVPIAVLDRFASNPYSNGDILIDDTVNTVDNFEDFGALIYYTNYSDANISLKETINDNCTGKLYAPLEDCIVLEIALNNNFDANLDNVYGFENTDGSINPHLHVGVNLANIGGYGINVFGIMYYWYLDYDFSVKIKEIKMISDKDLKSLIWNEKYCSYKTQEVLSNLIMVGTDYEKRISDLLSLKKELEQHITDICDDIKRLKKYKELNDKSL